MKGCDSIKKMALFVSLFTVAIFIVSVLTSVLFNFPKRHSSDAEVAERAEDVLKEGNDIL